MSDNPPVPYGSIIICARAHIPEGWHILDGTDGTPNYGTFILYDPSIVYAIKGWENIRETFRDDRARVIFGEPTDLENIERLEKKT